MFLANAIPEFELENLKFQIFGKKKKKLQKKKQHLNKRSRKQTFSFKV